MVTDLTQLAENPLSYNLLEMFQIRNEAGVIQTLDSDLYEVVI